MTDMMSPSQVDYLKGEGILPERKKQRRPARKDFYIFKYILGNHKGSSCERDRQSLDGIVYYAVDRDLIVLGIEMLTELGEKIRSLFHIEKAENTPQK